MRMVGWIRRGVGFGLGVIGMLDGVAENQTSGFSAISLTSRLPYTVTVTPYDMGSASVPTLQSYVSAQVGSEWVLLAGRTNGLHNFTNDGFLNFPPSAQNRTVWVIDIGTRQVWSRALNDASSGLTVSQIDSLSTTAAQSVQVGTQLYMVGGYGFDTTNGDFQTYDTLTVLDLPDVISWVKSGAPSLAVSLRQTTDPVLQITGGELAFLGGQMQLVFGQNFTGPYLPSSNGVYSRQVRTFEVDDDGTSVTIGSVDASPAQPPYRRRDLNILPFLQGSESEGFETGLVALSGVFTPTFGAWTVPVEVTAFGATYMANPLLASTFKQGMNGYRCAAASLFSVERDETHLLLFGGISAQYYDPTSQSIETDDNLPFINGITSIVRSGDGTYSQTYLGEIASIPNPSNGGQPFLFGASADFFPSESVSTFGNEILSLDPITSPTVIGYFYGGIIAQQPNFGPTGASDFIFEVSLNPLPPALSFFGQRLRSTKANSRTLRGKITGSASTIRYRLNDGSWKSTTANANGLWTVRVRGLQRGRNLVRIRSQNPAGQQSPLRKIRITRNRG